MMWCRYRMLSRPYAFNCVLRVRASSEFKIDHSVRIGCSSFELFLPFLNSYNMTPHFWCYSMGTSSQTRSMKMFSTSSAATLLPHMPMTLIFWVILDFHCNVNTSFYLSVFLCSSQVFFYFYFLIFFCFAHIVNILKTYHEVDVPMIFDMHTIIMWYWSFSLLLA